MTEAIELFDSSAHLSDEELLSLHLMVAPDVTEERHTEPGAEHPGVILLREGAGLRRTILES
ncbi:SAM-dependent methyltransferase, partial [Streptococcus danieliae]|nr:SAM-dependent methyltransferase [Streptococcus danieliae]